MAWQGFAKGLACRVVAGIMLVGTGAGFVGPPQSAVAAETSLRPKPQQPATGKAQSKVVASSKAGSTATKARPQAKPQAKASARTKVKAPQKAKAKPRTGAQAAATRGAAAAALAVGAGIGAGALANTPKVRADSQVWSVVASPSLGVAQSIGGYAGGCVAGARALPSEGIGYQVIRLSRQRYFGHPQLIDFISGFGRRVADAGIGIALIGDLGQARGGPLPQGHASHQSGLDVDVWLRLDLPNLGASARERLTEVKYVNHDAFHVSGDWSDRQARMIRLAAIDNRVERIFVNPAIKQALCVRSWQDRAWLRKVRPWYGHDGHMHVRLSCPAGSPQCENQKPLPEGEGCGDEVQSWLRQSTAIVERAPGSTPPRVSSVPATCQQVLRGPGNRVAAMSLETASD